MYMYKRAGMYIMYIYKYIYYKYIFYIFVYIYIYIYVYMYTVIYIYVYIYIYYIYIYIIYITIQHTSYARLHELSQSHFGDNPEDTLFSWLHICYAHLWSLRIEHSVCRVLCVPWIAYDLWPLMYVYEIGETLVKINYFPN